MYKSQSSTLCNTLNCTLLSQLIQIFVMHILYVGLWVQMYKASNKVTEIFVLTFQK